MKMTTPKININFNPRSPRGERQPGWCYNGSEAEFQSTLPARGATLAEKQPEQEKDISIHAPREGSDVQIIPALIWSSYFNPRSPRGERRAIMPPTAEKSRNFNPRSPRGERRYIPSIVKISIPHFNPRSPRGERRAIMPPTAEKSRNFNPRSPRGERRANGGKIETLHEFQSTLPARGATSTVIFFVIFILYFNPRSPRGERRVLPPPVKVDLLTFQSTLPARGATALSVQYRKRLYISIHAPREGSDAILE